MRFPSFKEFRIEQATEWADVARYCATELSAVLRELRAGLPKLTFAENFESFEVLGLAIPAGEEIAIRNLSREFIPSRYIITRKNEGGIYVCDGDGLWTQNFLYLKNTSGSEDALIDVIFLR